MEQAPVEITNPIEQREVIRQEVEKQYAQAVAALNVGRILEFIPELGKQVIRDEQGAIFELPTFEVIWKLMENNWQIVQEKWPQGFQQLQLTPLTISPLYLLQRVNQRLDFLSKSKKLFLPPKSADEQPTPVEWSKIIDLLGLNLFSTHLLYYPSGNLDSARSKANVIYKMQNKAALGWSVCLIERRPLLDSVATPSERTPLSRSTTAREYLSILHGKQMYEHESPFTLEDALTRFLTRLHQDSQVSYPMRLHDGLICLGNCLRSRSVDRIPSVYWSSAGELIVDTFHFDHQSSAAFGCRTAVRLNWDSEEERN